MMAKLILKYMLLSLVFLVNCSKINLNGSYTCTESQFQCKSGGCIPSIFQCDDEKNCHDASDEDPSICKSFRCTTSQFRCKSGKCVPQTWQCDNEKDCADGSDEDPTTCSQIYSSWKNFLHSKGMHIGSGRMKRFVQLSENQPNIAHQSCLLPNGTRAHCRHLRHCMLDDIKKDFTKLLDYLCVIKRSSIGVCCPDTNSTPTIESRFGSLAGDLPATAPEEEGNEAITKIERSENRGCGLSTRAQTKLVGARPTNPREWPWMASITPVGFNQYCGGVLITDRHILTAAHCTRRWKSDDLLVRLGEYDFSRKNDSRSYNFRVTEIRQHEEFDLTTYHNDIAILKLHRPAVFNTYVWPICLPPVGMNLINDTAMLIGWGTEWYGGPNSDVLMEVPVPIWDHQRCVDSFTDTIFEDNICAGGYEGGKDACQGDSGGPLMYQMESGRWTVIGIVSWGVRCGEANHPGIYTKVDQYMSWIMENTRF